MGRVSAGGHDAARAAARQRMHELGLGPSDIAHRAEAAGRAVTRQTVAAFMAATTSWPRMATLTAIEAGLAWPPGTLTGIAAGAKPPEGGPAAVTRTDDKVGAAALVIGWPEGLTEAERDEWEAAVRAASYERARQIRASRG